LDKTLKRDDIEEIAQPGRTQMGWFDRLFGRTPGPGSQVQLFARFRKKSRAPTDADLLKIAKDRKGHISRRAVRDEYNRLVLEKYAHDKA
jgi:hypothetical protein